MMEAEQAVATIWVARLEGVVEWREVVDSWTSRFYSIPHMNKDIICQRRLSLHYTT